MNTIKYFENVNPSVADKLIKLPFEVYKTIVENYKGIPPDDESNDDLRTQFHLLKKYCLLQKQNNYNLERTYKKSKASPLGRWFVEGIGLQRINALFRGILTAGLYTDFDMVNCHPVLLSYIIKKIPLGGHYLRQYVDNREKLLKELMNDLDCSRWEVKLLFIKSMNSENSVNQFWRNGKSKKIKNIFFIAFDTEMKILQKELEVKFKKEHALVKKNKKASYHSGHLLNHLCCNLENELLDKVMESVPQVGQTILMFDGYMTATHNTHARSGTLNKLTEEWGVEWTIKEIDDSIAEQVEDAPNDVYSSVGEDIVELGVNIVNELFNGRIVKCESDLYFKDVSGIWNKNLKTAKENISREIQNSDLWMNHPSKPDKFIKISKIPNSIRDLVNLIIPAQVPQNKDFINNMWENLRGKLCFKNGYYDFDTMEFTDNYDKLDTFFTAPIDFSKEDNPEVRKEIVDLIISPIWTLKEEREDFQVRCQLYEAVMYELSVMLAFSGKKENKNWMLMQGQRNSGKGVIMELLTQALGTDYIRTCEGGNFRTKKQGEDASKQNHWLPDYEFARLAVVSEVAPPDRKAADKASVDGTMIKKFRSGGDYIEARKLHENNKMFRHQSGLLFACNDWLPVIPNDAMDHCIEVEMMSEFVSGDNPVLKKDNTMTSYFVKQEDIKSDFCRRPDVLNEWILMLIQAYSKPVSVPDELKEAVEDSKCAVTEEDTLIAHFEYASAHHISFEMLRHYLEHWKNGLTQRKATRALSNHFGLGKSQKNGQGERGIRGIRIKVAKPAEFVDDDSEEE